MNQPFVKYNSTDDHTSFLYYDELVLDHDTYKYYVQYTYHSRDDVNDMFSTNIDRLAYRDKTPIAYDIILRRMNEWITKENSRLYRLPTPDPTVTCRFIIEKLKQEMDKYRDLDKYKVYEK